MLRIAETITKVFKINGSYFELEEAALQCKLHTTSPLYNEVSMH